MFTQKLQAYLKEEYPILCAIYGADITTFKKLGYECIGSLPISMEHQWYATQELIAFKMKVYNGHHKLGK